MNSRRRRKGNRDDLPMSADINVTSLVDVAFTLLIIFIITAPILQGGLNLNVPKASSQPITSNENPFLISVPPDGGADGKYVIEGQEFTLLQLEETLPSLHEAAGGGVIYIESDSLTIQGAMVPLYSLIGEMGAEMKLAVKSKTPRG